MNLLFEDDISYECWEKIYTKTGLTGKFFSNFFLLVFLKQECGPCERSDPRLPSKSYPRVAFHHTNIDRKKDKKQTNTKNKKRLQSKIIIKR